MQKKQPPIKLKSAQTKNNQLNSSFNSTSHCNSNAQHDINANVSTIGKICCGNGANVKDNVNITPSNLSLSYPQLNQSPVVECSSSTLPLSVAIPSFTPPPIAVLSNRGSNTHRKNIIMMPPPTPIVNMPDHLHSNQSPAINKLPIQNSKNQQTSQLSFHRLNQVDHKDQLIKQLKQQNSRLKQKVLAYQKKVEDINLIAEQLQFRREQQRSMQEHIEHHQETNIRLRKHIAQLEDFISEALAQGYCANKQSHRYIAKTIIKKSRKDAEIQLQSEKDKERDKENRSEYSYNYNQKGNLSNCNSAINQLYESQIVEESGVSYRNKREGNSSRRLSLSINPNTNNVSVNNGKPGSVGENGNQKQNHAITPKAQVSINLNSIIKNQLDSMHQIRVKKKVFI